MKFVLNSEFFHQLCKDDTVFFVGTTVNNGRDCFLSDCVRNGCWEVYTADDVQKDRLRGMKPGMVILAKVTQGAGRDIRIKGAGIILSKAEEILDSQKAPTGDFRVHVAWVYPTFSKEVPFAGRGGAIHYTTKDKLEDVCREIVVQVKARFLKIHCCNIVDSEVVF